MKDYFYGILVIIILYFIGCNIMTPNNILNMDNIQCTSTDHESYVFQLKNIKLDVSNKQTLPRIKYDISFQFLIECYKHKSKYIKKNMNKFFNRVLEKANVTIDRNYTLFEDKGYIGLVKIIEEVGENYLDKIDKSSSKNKDL